ncbi:MAG: phosphoribosylformylglycinamidine synthase subunit PurS, partial [Candidatus Omnitrophota bacterium]|nr:phosphoribosylformylglycinamidine synthase subunit PurS [Candidatus Omnitrophota bacterium]
MIWRVEVKHKPGVFDPHGESIRKDIVDSGLSGITRVDVVDVYHIDGALSQQEIGNVSRRLLADPVTQEYAIVQAEGFKEPPAASAIHLIEIAHHPGVMDPVEASTLKGIQDLGFKNVSAVRTAKKYCFHGNVSGRAIENIVGKILCNKLIQHVVKHPVVWKSPAPKADGPVNVVVVDLLKASEKQLKGISQQGQLFLN